MKSSDVKDEGKRTFQCLACNYIFTLQPNQAYDGCPRCGSSQTNPLKDIKKEGKINNKRVLKG